MNELTKKQTLQTNYIKGIPTFNGRTRNGIQ